MTAAGRRVVQDGAMRGEAPALFRPAALAARRAKPLGRIVLARPPTFGMLAGAAALVGASVVAFLVWGSYTEHVTLAGRLVPDGGVITVHAPQSGIIVERRVSEGDRVSRGDALYVVRSERHSSALAPTQALVLAAIDRRRGELERQIAATRALVRAEDVALQRSIAARKIETRRIADMIATQQARVELAARAERLYERLHRQGHAAQESLIARRAERLEQTARLQSLQGEAGAVERELSALEGRALVQPLEHENRLAELERAAAALRQERLENEARRQVVVVAPEGGIVAAVLGQVGRSVEPSHPLLSIVPRAAPLHAELDAPSRAVGFAEVGDRVLLRYHAYPYQKFGHHEGVVTSVSRATLPAAASPGAGSEPAYRVVVELRAQTVVAYGEARELRAGMTLEADVPQKTRRLYEWVLDPLRARLGSDRRSEPL